MKQLERIWIEKETKDRLYEKKGRKTFSELIGGLLNENETKKDNKKRPFFPQI